MIIGIVTDIYEVPRYQKCTQVLNRFQRHYLTSKSIAKALFKVVGCNGFWMIFCFLISNLLQFAGPLFLNQILVFLEDPDREKYLYKGYLYAGLLLVCLTVKTIFQQHGYHASNIGNVRTFCSMVKPPSSLLPSSTSSPPPPLTPNPLSTAQSTTKR